MKDNEILMCLIAFILGYLIYRIPQGNGFTTMCNPTTTPSQICPDGQSCPDCGSNSCKCPPPPNCKSKQVDWLCHSPKTQKICEQSWATSRYGLTEFCTWNVDQTKCYRRPSSYCKLNDDGTCCIKNT